MWGQCCNHLYDPALMAGPKPLLTEFGIHHRLVVFHVFEAKQIPLLRLTFPPFHSFSVPFSFPTARLWNCLCSPTYRFGACLYEVDTRDYAKARPSQLLRSSQSGK